MSILRDIRVIELAGIGPAPFAGMMLSDMGAEVVRIDRVGNPNSPASNPMGPMERGKKPISLNLKSPEGLEVALKLIESADVLIEGFRAGVAERLGLGPDDALKQNPKLVYGRMTGWGQAGPLAQTAGHDLNYISLSGPLAHIGREGEPPSIPLNLIGDFGGGSIFLVLGICAALLEVSRGGEGQVIDTAMVDGSAYLLSPIYAARHSNFWTDERGTNMLDSGAHFYEVYETADNLYISVGAIEPQFYAILLEGMGLKAEDLPDQLDRGKWREMKQKFQEIFKTRTRKEWMEVFEGSDACVAPVLSMAEAPSHHHAKEREAFFAIGEINQPMPAPRFSRNKSQPSQKLEGAGAYTDELLKELGYDSDAVANLKDAGAVS